MANSRSRKSAPNRPGTSRDQRVKSNGTGSTSRTAEPVDEPTEPAGDEADSTTTAADATVKATAATAAPIKTTPTKTTAKKSAPAKVTAKKVAASKAGSSPGSAGKRFGDGAGARGEAKASASTKSGGRGGRGGRGGGRTAPPVRVGQPKPWGMIAATVAVLLFAGAAIGYAVYQANSTGIPDSPQDIEGITVAEYAPEGHVASEQSYPESPGVGGLHDPEWADCDGAIYDNQIREENAVHSLEHGAVWIAYNPDAISDADLSVLTEYVANQPYIFMSPYAGLSSLISLQTWNHQVFVDAVDDPRITQFIQLLRQNPETTPEQATCTNPAFLTDPLLEGDPSRAAEGGSGPAVTDPAAPTP
ncbi:MAG: DUF3105 domain-containing protein [Geodermatophilaceae bacterium]|nr:DUF3105 domain-containing protein [Geodermatophilaceae bacterium]